MTDETKTCQVKMHDGQPCGRPELKSYKSDGKCVLHTADRKNVTRFQAELDLILKDADGKCYDFTQVVFPADGWEFPAEFKKEFLCEKAEFLGICDFWDAVFHELASFTNTVFRAPANFLNVKFMKSAYFNSSRFTEHVEFWGDARFEGLANFEGAKFEKGADFQSAYFKRGCFDVAEFDGTSQFSTATFEDIASFHIAKVNGEIEFKGTTFQNGVSFKRARLTEKALVLFDAEDFGGHLNVAFGGESNFRYMRLDRGYELVFRKVSLERTLFLDTDVSKVTFVDVEWPGRERLGRRWIRWIKPLRNWFSRKGLFERKATFDELATYKALSAQKLSSVTKVEQSQPEYPMIAELYRQLQANYVGNYRYREAGYFYIGEQEMARKNMGIYRRYLSTNMVYKLVSNYGQSTFLPLMWLSTVFLVAPCYFLLDGILLYGPSHEVNYEWSWSLSDLLFLKADYWNAAGANLSLATFNRAAIGKYLAEPYKHGIITLESAVLIVLISFLVLALRRAFKRKSF